MSVPTELERKKLLIPRRNIKYGVKDYILAVVVFGVMVALLCTILKIALKPKPVATVEQIESAITLQGYVPTDIADLYYQKDPAFKRDLLNCIGFEDGDIHFEFFNFSDDAGAEDIFRQAYQRIMDKYPSADPRRRGGTFRANVAIYNVESDGIYSVAISVGNTAVYAYCNAENRNVIDSILNKIDYLSM